MDPLTELRRTPPTRGPGCLNARGVGAGAFPPLAGNTDLLIDRMFPVYVVLNGVEGSLTINGVAYQGVMPPFDHLPDEEIAAVINFIRAAWGNAELRPDGFADLDAPAAKEARSSKMKPAEVHAYRQAHQ